jgi:hypothetical protein
MDKKAMSKNTMWVVLIGIGLLFAYLYTQDVQIGDTTLSSNPGNCMTEYEVTLSSITSGVTKQEKGGNNFDLILTSGDLNSANTTKIDFTITSTRKDECYTADGGALSDKLDYVVLGYDFSNVVTPSDSNVYNTVYYSATPGEGYNVTADGTAWATGKQVQDTTTWSTAGSAVISVDVEDFTTLDKGIAQDFDYMNVATVKVADGTINLKYMKD